MPGESVLDRAARMDAAAAVLADLERDAPDLAAYARRLLGTVPVPLYSAAIRRTTVTRPRVLGVAA